MATRVIDDTKLNDIAVAIQAKDSGGQMTVDEMPTRIDALQVADPEEQLIKLFTNTIEYIKINNQIGKIPAGADINNQYIYSNLKFFSVILKTSINADLNLFHKCNLLKYANISKTNYFEQRTFKDCTNIKSIILLYNGVTTLVYNSSLQNSGIANGTGYVWVFDSLKSGYQSATNWSVYASQIKGFSEAPLYSDSVTYEIGDVCQYNGRFYGYCKRDLTSSTGNSPTGTTADNDYWEYVADIEVI